MKPKSNKHAQVLIQFAHCSCCLTVSHRWHSRFAKTLGLGSRDRRLNVVWATASPPPQLYLQGGGLRSEVLMAKHCPDIDKQQTSVELLEVEGSGQQITVAAPARNSTDNIQCKKPAEWLPCLSPKPRHSNRMKDRWVLNKTSK